MNERVVDPEAGSDMMRNVGTKDGKIAINCQGRNRGKGDHRRHRSRGLAQLHRRDLHIVGSPLGQRRARSFVERFLENTLRLVSVLL